MGRAVVVYLEPDTHTSPQLLGHTMKLVYTLTGLATVLATGNQAFQLSTKNVQQLQHALEDRVEQKYTNMKRQLRQNEEFSIVLWTNSPMKSTSTITTMLRPI